MLKRVTDYDPILLKKYYIIKIHIEELQKSLLFMARVFSISRSCILYKFSFASDRCLNRCTVISRSDFVEERPLENTRLLFLSQFLTILSNCGGNERGNV